LQQLAHSNAERGGEPGTYAYDAGEGLSSVHHYTWASNRWTEQPAQDVNYYYDTPVASDYSDVRFGQPAVALAYGANALPFRETRTYNNMLQLSRLTNWGVDMQYLYNMGHNNGPGGADDRQRARRNGELRIRLGHRKDIPMRVYPARSGDTVPDSRDSGLTRFTDGHWEHQRITGL
jgi:hypothetical protein